MSSLPVMLVVFDAGSLSPWEICTAAEGLCEPVFVVTGPLTDPADETRMLLDDLGEVIEFHDGTPDFDQLRAAEPRGIVTFSDSRLELCATIAEKLGLRFHSTGTARRLANKSAQRSALTSAGLPSPRFAEVDTVAGIDDALAHVGLPAVIKPIRGAGSRDTYRVDEPEQARELLHRCIHGRGTPMIVEELIVGDPASAGPSWADIVSVESLFVSGQIHHVATTGRFPFVPPFRETGSFTPSRMDSAQREEATRLAEAAARALGVVDGFVHTELKLTTGGMYVIEVNGRLGGFVAWLLNRSRCLDLGVLALQAALGQPVDIGIEPVDAPGATTAIAFQRLLVPPVGARRFEALAGIDEVAAADSIEAVHFWGEPGSAVDCALGYGACLGIVSGAVATHEDLDTVLQTIDSGLHLTFS